MLTRAPAEHAEWRPIATPPFAVCPTHDIQYPRDGECPSCDSDYDLKQEATLMATRALLAQLADLVGSLASRTGRTDIAEQAVAIARALNDA